MDESGMSNIVGSLIRNNNTDTWGQNGIWVIFLLFLCFGGGGFGWGANRGNAATQQDITQGFNFNALENDVRSNGAAINTLSYNNLAQANNIAQAINTASDLSQAGFAGVNNGIGSLKYEMAQNTCAITTNATANTQRILDRLCAMEAAAKDNTIAQLRSDLQAAQLTLGNAAQTQNIVSALKPSPVPAYVVSSPYASLTSGTTIA